MIDTVTRDNVESRATNATRASSMMEILKARRKQTGVPVQFAFLYIVESRATPATPAITPMEMLRATQDLNHSVHPTGIRQEVLTAPIDQGLHPEQPASVEILNNVAEAMSTGSGLPVRLCLGCGNPFTPSADNKVYCRAKCWNTPKAALKPAG